MYANMSYVEKQKNESIKTEEQGIADSGKEKGQESSTDLNPDNDVYANIVAPLLKKIGDSLRETNYGDVPIISEDLKKKLIQAIMEV